MTNQIVLMFLEAEEALEFLFQIDPERHLGVWVSGFGSQLDKPTNF